MTEILVTICTPVYNHEQYLHEYFESIINQTYKNIELILIDDASSDQSVKVIEKWLTKLEERFVTVTFIPRDENKGLIYNCNEGVDLSKGKYFYLFASDDIMLPNNIEEKVSNLEKNPDYALVYSDGYLIFENSKNKLKNVFNSMFRKKFSNYTNHYSGDVKDEIFINNFIRAATVCIRKQCIYEVGKYSSKYILEDNYMWLKLTQKYKIGYVDKPLIKYRVHNNSLSHSIEHMEKLNDSLFRLIEDFEEAEIYSSDTVKKAYKNFFSMRAKQSFNYSDYEEFINFYKLSNKGWRLYLRKIILKFKMKGLV